MKSSTCRIGRALAFCTLTAIALTGVMPAVAGGLQPRSSRVVNIPVGRSSLLHFQHMKRVQVVDGVVEVVVASLDDLSIYGRQAGNTIVYVWDKLGVHEIAVTVEAITAAQTMAGDLRAVLGNDLKYTPAGERTILVEGTLPPAEAQRAHDIIAAYRRENVEIVDLVRAEGQGATGAAAAVAAELGKILDGEVEYIVWNNNTLVVRGSIGDRERLDAAHRLLASVSDPQVKVVDLLEYQESVPEPPVQQIAQALGEGFRVWQVSGRVVAVEGQVQNAQQLDNLNRILQAFSSQAEIINLVRVGRPDINAAVAALQGLVGNRFTVRSLDADTIVVQGAVATDEDLTRVREIIAGYPTGYRVLDLLRVALPERQQVCVQVRVVEVNRGDLKRLGINWGQLEFDGDTVSFVDQPWLIQNMSNVLGFGGEVGNILTIGSQLDLLREKNAARILSEPNLLVDDGGTATMQVGGEIPIPVAQVGGGGEGAISVEWKPFGVILEIQPTILEDSGKINVRVTPEVSSLDFANAVTIGGFTLPALRARRASTVVTMADGGTLVLGGLIANDQSRTLRKIPLLGDLPLIGELFKRREFINGETELVILVSPKVVSGSEPLPESVQPGGALMQPLSMPAQK